MFCLQPPTPPTYGPGFETGGNVTDSGLRQTWQVRSVSWALRDSWGKASALQADGTVRVCKVRRHVPRGHFHVKSTNNSEWALPYCSRRERRRGSLTGTAVRARAVLVESVPKGSRDWRQMGPVMGMTLSPMNWLQTPVRLKEHRVICSRSSCNFSDSPNFSCLLSAPKPKGPTGWDSTWGRSSRDRPQLCSMLSHRLPA